MTLLRKKAAKEYAKEHNGNGRAEPGDNKTETQNSNDDQRRDGGCSAESGNEVVDHGASRLDGKVVEQVIGFWISLTKDEVVKVEEAVEKQKGVHQAGCA